MPRVAQNERIAVSKIGELTHNASRAHHADHCEVGAGGRLEAQSEMNRVARGGVAIGRDRNLAGGVVMHIESEGRRAEE